MFRVTIAQLEAFYWTVTLGSVDAASRRLHLAQPSVSQRLKALQVQFASPLIERHGRGLKITHPGQEVLLRAERILHEVGQMAEDPDPAQFHGPVRIGMAEGLALVCLPELTKRLRIRHPLMKLEINVGISSELEPRLHDQELDLAFLVNPSEHEDCTLVPLGSQETSWVAGKAWHLPDLVRPQDLVALPIIANESGSINSRQVKGWFASAGLSPQILDTCNSVSMLAHLVTAGTSIGILPVPMAQPQVQQGVLRILRTAPDVPDTPIHATFRSHGLTNPARSVLSEARQLLNEFGYTRRPSRTVQL